MNIIDKIIETNSNLTISEETLSSSSEIVVVENKELQNTKQIEINAIKPQHSLDDLDKKLGDDFDKSRSVLNDLLDIGMRNIKDLSTLANDSETPRAFEIVGTLINAVKDTASGLLDLHHKKAQIEHLKSQGVIGKNTSITDIGNIENAVFVGTHSDLMKVMKRTPVELENSLDDVILDPKPEPREDDIDLDTFSYMPNDFEDEDSEIEENVKNSIKNETIEENNK